jgi:hypothetical protein
MAGEYDHGKAAQHLREAIVKQPETPFPRHWIYYIALKFIVIAAAVLIGIYVYYLL